MGGQSSSGFLLVLLLGFLGWWWWPSLEPELPRLVEQARSTVLSAIGQAEQPEVAGLTVVTAASPVPVPPRPTAVPTPEPTAAAFCEPGEEPAFRFGFAALKQELGTTMGIPLECEHTNPGNGDTLQATSTGLAVYDKVTNTPRFTDGWRSWALTARGLLAWEGHDAPPELTVGSSSR